MFNIFQIPVNMSITLTEIVLFKNDLSESNAG